MMKHRPYSPSTIPRASVWVLACCIIIALFCFIYALLLYHDIEKSKTAGFEKVKETVLQQTNLKHITNVSRFDEATSYFILTGYTGKNEKMVFVPVKKQDKAHFTIIDERKTITKAELKKRFKNTYPTYRIVSIKPAMIDKQPLWEITYHDHSGHYVFDYFSLKDGKRQQQLRLKSMYK